MENNLNSAMLSNANLATMETSNLNQVLGSSIAVSLEDSATIKLASGQRMAKLISRGANSKLSESIAIALPVLDASSLLGIGVMDTYPELASYIADSLVKLQDDAVRKQLESVAIAGGKSTGVVVQHASIQLQALESYLISIGGAGNGGIGQLSSERITAWFESEAKELLIVALADRLGISDAEVTDATVARLESIAAQMRDNLAKLSSKKAVSFDPRVKEALNWALSIATLDADDKAAIPVRLSAKLNAPIVSEISLADALGF